MGAIYNEKYLKKYWEFKTKVLSTQRNGIGNKVESNLG